MNIVLQIAYDGSHYLGWQKSIESLLESSIEQILQHKVVLQAASRTDRGVHAEGQMVNFVTTKEGLDLDLLRHGLNCLLPADIRILSCEQVESHFHATLSAKAKQYLYRLYTGPIHLPFYRHNHWHLPDLLDLERMKIAANLLLGEHDFVAFRNFRKGNMYNDTTRTVHAIDFEQPEPNLLYIKVTANNFLYKMARNIVGTLVYVGLDKFSPEHVLRVLSEKKRSLGGITAPAHGLSLYKVFYSLPHAL